MEDQQHASVCQPVLLFSHIPLWRPPGTLCGKLRTKSLSLEEGFGVSYSNMLGAKVSRMILDTFKPSVVLSGDDHDYCNVLHDCCNTIEHTIGTFSWLQGITKPWYGAIVLDEVAATVAADECRIHRNSGQTEHVDSRARLDSIRVRHCALPMQLTIYLTYAGFGAVLLMAVIVLNRGLLVASLFEFTIVVIPVLAVYGLLMAHELVHI